MAGTPVQEGSVSWETPGAEQVCVTWYKTFGNIRKSDTTPLVVLHGGPGGAHEYLLNFTSMTERQGIPINTEKAEALRKNHKFSFPNPLATLVVLTNPEAALLLFCVGIAFSCIYAISTGASVALTESYGLNQLDIGLVFISLGAGCVLSAFITGKLVDYN